MCLYIEYTMAFLNIDKCYSFVYMPHTFEKVLNAIYIINNILYTKGEPGKMYFSIYLQ